MRFFIALEIPEENKAQLLEIQHQLKQLVPQIILTDNNKLHLTIAFVGEQPADLKEPLVEVISKATDKIPAFEVTPGYIDGFPNLHNPRTFWIGMKGDIDKVLILRERVKDSLNSLGLETDERRFIPHIALGKVNDFHLHQDLERKLQEIMEKDFSPIQVSSIKLFESIPSHNFHQHNTLAEIRLS